MTEPIPYLISQREAVAMLEACGISRTAAYNRLKHDLPTRVLVGSNVYSRVDVELLCTKVRERVAS